MQNKSKPNVGLANSWQTEKKVKLCSSAKTGEALSYSTKQMAQPLGPSGRNNGSQAHEINKWALKRQVGLKKLRKREIAYP